MFQEALQCRGLKKSLRTPRSYHAAAPRPQSDLTSGTQHFPIDHDSYGNQARLTCLDIVHAHCQDIRIFQVLINCERLADIGVAGSFRVVSRRLSSCIRGSPVRRRRHSHSGSDCCSKRHQRQFCSDVAVQSGPCRSRLISHARRHRLQTCDMPFYLSGFLCLAHLALSALHCNWAIRGASMLLIVGAVVFSKLPMGHDDPVGPCNDHIGLLQRVASSGQDWQQKYAFTDSNFRILVIKDKRYMLGTYPD